MLSRSVSADVRFWAKVEVVNDCWLWRGAINPSGYGHFKVNGKYMTAHRFAYEMANGPLKNGTYVCHTCDTPACVNPKHLFEGTAADNAKDCVAKGRHSARPGERRNKLSAEAARAIRVAWKDNVATRKALAEMFGVSRSAITRVTRGHTWGLA